MLTSHSSFVQVKTLSLITYFLRGFADLMRPYEDAVAKNVLSLIQVCPPEAVSTRKELLVDFRHILATDFRKGFNEYLDYFLDENLLMGSGRQAHETLRPLAFSTIADLVHHSRDSLTFRQISRVVYLFAKNVNDPLLSSAIQTTSVRILVNICDRFNTSHPDQVGPTKLPAPLLTIGIIVTILFRMFVWCMFSFMFGSICRIIFTEIANCLVEFFERLC